MGWDYEIALFQKSPGRGYDYDIVWVGNSRIKLLAKLIHTLRTRGDRPVRVIWR